MSREKKPEEKKMHEASRIKEDTMNKESVGVNVAVILKEEEEAITRAFEKTYNYAKAAITDDQIARHGYPVDKELVENLTYKVLLSVLVNAMEEFDRVHDSKSLMNVIAEEEKKLN